MRQSNAYFANFICRFGSEKVLLDYVEEIVIPAFTNDTYVRTHGKKTSYHFYEVELMNLGANTERPLLVLAGRFVKESELTRHQVFDQNRGLVKDERSISTAPSAFFVLILNNHRLIYLPETPFAPDLDAFRTTAENFLTKRHEEFIKELHSHFRQSLQPVTKKAILEANPRPTLEVIHLTGRMGIEQFLRKFETLRRIEFRVVRPNDDIDAGEILSQVRSLSDTLGSTNTKVNVANNDGLDISASIEAIAEATASGNQDVSISGVDAEGNRLSGNNQKFSLSTEIDNIPPSKVGLVRTLVDRFSALLTLGTISAPSANASSEKLRSLSRKL